MTVVRGRFVPPDTERYGTLHPLIDEYVAERQDRRRFAVGSAKTAWYKLQRLADAHGDLPVQELGVATVDRYLDQFARLSPGTQLRAISAGKAFCVWLHRRGLITGDPFHGIDKPRSPRMMPRALDGDQVARLFAQCDCTRDRLILSLMVNEGLRCIEVTGLEMADLSFRDRTMRIVGKGGHERVLPITDETWSLITQYLEEVDHHAGALILDKRWNRNPIGAAHLSNYVAELMAAAGVKMRRHDRVSAHALRHTAATDMLRGGAHIKDIQAVLGHSSLANTQIYLPLQVNDLRTTMGGRRYQGDGADHGRQ